MFWRCRSEVSPEEVSFVPLGVHNSMDQMKVVNKTLTNYRNGEVTHCRIPTGISDGVGDRVTANTEDGRPSRVRSYQ